MATSALQRRSSFTSSINGVLRDGERLRVEGNALAAMTLMIALSDPSEKDSMVTLVENFIA